MKRLFILLFVPFILFSKQNIKVGVSTSFIYENGEAYPVFGVNIGYYPVSFFFVEASGEYIMKNSYKEFAFPVTANFIYNMRFFSPYAGFGVAYHYYSYDSYSDNSLGYRLKLGFKIADRSGASVYFETSYDVPDFREGGGRWYFTGRADKSFNFEF